MSKLKISMLTSVVLALGAATAHAGRGGNFAAIRNAANTNSTDAIIAELERSERLICDACIGPVMELLDHDRYEVREAAAWWFARRPVMKAQLTQLSFDDLEGSDSRRARNAADILGTFRQVRSIPALTAAVTRTDLSAEARVAIVRALGTIGHQDANPAIEVAMGDGEAVVRYQALDAWRWVRRQTGAPAAVALLDDGDARVRERAAALVGAYREASAVSGLIAALGDDEAFVRRNAAWALGQIGDPSAREALEAAADDPSPLVRLTARVAIQNLR
jgi:HEAT repeat protein